MRTTRLRKGEVVEWSGAALAGVSMQFRLAVRMATLY
jgi:hypothetical protein